MRKTSLITGGTRGIGLGIAKALASEGFDLAINGLRKEEKVTEVLERLREYGVKVIYCQGDISKKDDRDFVIQKVKSEFGQLNLLVNNAGVAPKKRNDVLETSEESFEYVMNTNLRGTFFLTQSIAKWLVQQKNSSREKTNLTPRMRRVAHADSGGIFATFGTMITLVPPIRSCSVRCPA